MTEDSHPTKQAPRKPLSARLTHSTPRVGPSGGSGVEFGPQAGADGFSDAQPGPAPYRVLVTGSRDWDDELTLEAALAMAVYQRVPAVIVHGACRTGADAIASQWTRSHRVIGLTEEAHPALWQWHGKAAGPRRNAEMVSLGADVCLAFIRNGSRGASHAAALAEQAGIPVRRFTA